MDALQIIFVFALALLVSGCAALAWITYDLLTRMRAVESSTDMTAKLSRNVASRLVSVEKTATEKSSTALAARVDELSEAVGKLSDTHRKFAGRMDRRYQLDRGREQDEDPNGTVTDAKWLALRAAQDAQGGPPR